MRISSLLLSCTYITFSLSVVRAFNVTVGTPTQCDDLSVSWTGGQAPFQIIVTPFAPSQTLRNISVPASAFSNGKGSYSIPQFPFKNGTKFLLTMSDATGFGSGGTSTILNVGAPVANNNCNTTIQSPDFFYSTPSQLQQCNDYIFNAYSGAVLPATITGLIPGGEYVVLPVTGPNYTWVADVEAGTSLIFFMMDSQGRQGGVSPLNTVDPLSHTSCLNVNSPSSTASAPSQTSSQSSPSKSKTATVEIIAGSVVGGVVLLVLLIILGVWCIRKTSGQSHHKGDYEAIHYFPSKSQTDYGSHLPLIQHESQLHVSSSDPFIHHSRQISFTDGFAGSSSMSSASRPTTGQTMIPIPFPHQALPIVLAPPVHPGKRSHRTNPSSGNFSFNDPFSPLPTPPSHRPNSNTSDGRIAAVAGPSTTTPPAHIIVHTDIEDVPAPPDAPEVIELPPQYTDRQPLASQPQPTSARNQQTSRS